MNARSWAITLVIFFVVSLAYTHTIFRNIYYGGGQDWSINQMYLAVQRESLLRYRQIPLWNPFHCGGYIMLGFPESSVLSPFFIFILAFGELLGVKLRILACYVFGLLGMFLLSQKMGLTKLAAYYSSFVFVLSTMVSVAVGAGMHAYITIFYIPWILFFFMKAYDKRVYVAPTALSLTLIYFDGEPYWFLYTFIFLGAYVAYDIVSERKMQGATILLTVAALCLLLGAVKLIPTIEWYLEHPRDESIKDYSGFSLTSFSHAMLDRRQAYYDERGFETKARGFLRGMSYYWDENAMYVGVIPTMLFIFGIIFSKKNGRLVFLAALFLWLSFGHRLTALGLSPYTLLQSLPVFDSLRVATRFRAYFLLCFSIISGMMLSRIECLKIKNKSLHKTKNSLVFIIVLLVLADLILVGSNVYRYAFIKPAAAVDRSQPFSQHVGSRTEVYENYLKNWGTTDSTGSVNCLYNEGHINHATPVESNDYQGEAYLDGTVGDVEITHFSPNRIKVHVNSEENGTLVLNQNYDNGWKVKDLKDGGVTSFNGLIATKVSKGESTIEFYFLSTSVVIGAIISVITTLWMIAHILEIRTRR